MLTKGLGARFLKVAIARIFQTQVANCNITQTQFVRKTLALCVGMPWKTGLIRIALLAIQMTIDAKIWIRITKPHKICGLHVLQVKIYVWESLHYTCHNIIILRKTVSYLQITLFYTKALYLVISIRWIITYLKAKFN